VTHYIQLGQDDVPGIRDAVDNPYNCEITVVVIDMRNSTGQKFTKSGIAWNSEFLKVHQVLQKGLALLDELGIRYAMSFGGDGITVVIDTNSGAHHLINMVIAVLEEIDDLSTARNGSPTGQIDAKLSAGIATGEGYRFRPDHHGGIEHLSSAIDRASRLCSVASPGALFIDPDTANSANMRMVSSSLGRFMRHRPEDYLGERQSVQLRGVPEPVEYFEINWGRQLYGVRSATVTEISTSPTPPPSPTSPAPAITSAGVTKLVNAGGGEQFVGTVKIWNNDRGFGFVIDTKTGEEFYFGPKSLVYEDDREHLAPGVELVFASTGTTEGDRRRLAAPVLVVGQEADGRVSYIHPDKPFGFIVVTDDRGRQLKFHMAVPAEARRTLHRGDEVSFTVATNAVGARALDVERLDQTDGGDAAA